MSLLSSSSETSSEPAPVSTSLIESLLAQDLYNLSLNERENALEDLHGVADVVHETPDLVSNRLAELERELSEILEKTAYDLAACQDPNYVRSRVLRLKFLRAERFDAYKAAKRLVRFFDEKLALFGQTCLDRELLLSDLDQEDRTCLESGLMTLLPVRDRAGRYVMTWMPAFRDGHKPLCRIRCLLYLLCMVANEEETQKKGLVVLWLDFGPRRTYFDMSACGLGTALLQGAPARFGAFHVCISNFKVTALWSSFIRPFLEPAILTRIRFHCGSSVEIHYKLMSFGILTGVLPMTVTGELMLDYHQEWLAGRDIIESELGNSIAVPWVHHSRRRTSLGSGNGSPCQIGSSATFHDGGQERPPTGGNDGWQSFGAGAFPASASASTTVQGTLLPLDFALHEHSVVCSRVKKKEIPSGNRHLDALAKACLQGYSNATKSGKTAIVSRIVGRVRSNAPDGKGSFVRFHEEQWWEADEVGARYKVTAVMRNLLPSRYKSSTKAKVAKRRSLPTAVVPQDPSKREHGDGPRLDANTMPSTSSQQSCCRSP